MKVFVSVPNNNEIMDTFFPENVKKYLESRFETEYCPYDRMLTGEEFSKMTKDFDAVITCWGHPPISYDMLRGGRVRLIAHTGGSVGSLVDGSVYSNGIKVISGNLMYAESVAEGVIAYMLTGLRKIPDYVNRVRDGKWRVAGDYSEGLLDRSVGIIGMGTISKILVKMLRIFNADIKIYSGHAIDREFLERYSAEQVSLEEALKCDIVSLHSAMNEKTRGMIGKEQLAFIKDGALFLNTARGAIVDEKAMIEELKKNRFRAVLDVFCSEPLEEDSELRKMENVYCIPHMAGPTIDRRAAITKRLADNIIKFENREQMELEIKKEDASRMTVGG